MISGVDGVYRSFEDAREGTARSMLVGMKAKASHGLHILSDALIVPLASKKAVYDHDWVSCGFARVIVEPICKVNDPQVRRSMKRARP